MLTGQGSLTRQVFVALKTRIESGDIGAGTRLPGSRALARTLRVARGTVVSAYAQLESEGYCRTRARSGTRVVDLPPLAGDPEAAAARARARVRMTQWRSGVSTAVFDLRPGLPSETDFPLGTWVRLARRELQRDAAQRFSYPEPEGLPRLRQAVAEHLRRQRGLPCTADQVMITQGAQQAFSLIARALLPIGVPVAVEDPGYLGFSQAAQAAGVDLAPVPVDDQGLMVEALPEQAGGVCVTPAHQFPTGVILSAARRRALLAWAESRQAWIVEDDYDSDYRFDAAPVEPLKLLDRTGRVLLVGSFSKTVFPDLRIGFVVADPEQLQVLALMKNLDDAGSSTLNQAALAAFLEEGHYLRHLRRSRRSLGLRRRALLDALGRHFGPAARVTGAPAGLHLVLDLGLTEEQEESIIRLARHRGLALQSQRAYSRGAPSPGLVLGFARLEPDQLDAAVGRLAGLVEGLPRPLPGMRRR
jgi:GntR family transcriptional regulator / MocR family aminotransferase